MLPILRESQTRQKTPPRRVSLPTVPTTTADRDSSSILKQGQPYFRDVAETHVSLPILPPPVVTRLISESSYLLVAL